MSNLCRYSGVIGWMVLCSMVVTANVFVSSAALAQNTTGDANLAAWKAAISEKEQTIAKRLKDAPTGKFYEVTVPDTLDLADRAALAINCLTGVLDPDYGYEMYFVSKFDSNPAYMLHEASGLPTNNPKFAEALPMMRVMSGSDQNLDIERGMMLRTLALTWTDGLYYAPLIGRPWHQMWDKADEDFANVYGNARLLLAYMAWYEYDGNPLWKEYAKGIVEALRKIAISKDDYAYFPDPKIGESFSYPKSGYASNLPEPTDAGFGIHMYFSGVIRGLAKWAAETGDKDALELARKLTNFIRQPKMWIPGTEIAGIVRPEKAHFSGHFHAHAASLRGLLEYAIVAHDAGLKQFVRDGYEYARNFGISRIGWFPENARPNEHCESCCVADMVALAVKLSDAGVGDYWEDLDGYVRNQFVEQQLVSKSLLEKCVSTATAHTIVVPQETGDRVIERNIGGFVGHGDVAALPGPWIMHCCTGNAAQALYYAWEGIVREKGNGAVQVNLLLNRVSPWLDVDSYLPYEGKVVIRNKSAKSLFVRIPTWVSLRDVQCKIGSKSVSPAWVGNYLVLERLKKNDKITIEFPMLEETTKATLDGITYTMLFRGNTLVDVFPRNHGDRAYPIYQRAHMRANDAPTVKKKVYVQDAKIKW